jgi:hypothetical protein
VGPNKTAGVLPGINGLFRNSNKMAGYWLWGNRLFGSVFLGVYDSSYLSCAMSKVFLRLKIDTIGTDNYPYADDLYVARKLSSGVFERDT